MDSTLRSDLIDQQPPASAGRSTLLQAVRTGRIGLLSPAVAGLVTLVLLSATLYAGWSVQSAVRALMRDSISSVLAANVTGLELWLADQADEASRLAKDPRLQDWFAASINRFPDESESVSTDFKAESQLLQRETERRGDLGWALITPSGIVLQSSLPSTEAMTFEIAADTQDQLDTFGAAVTRPFMTQLSENQPRAVMCAIAPAGSRGAEQCYLALVIDPEEKFTNLLDLASIGQSGKTYAIDKQAVLLSRCRFEDELRRAGLLAPGAQSPLNIVVRDPGVDIRHRSVDALPPSAWAMTAMADNVTRGGAGSNVVGYNDYRGVPVIGAWHWMPNYGMGVATELDVEEAYAATRLFRNAFVALLSLVLIAGASLLFLAWILRRLDRSVQEDVGQRRRLGQYELNHAIGRGGMGRVYLARHAELQRDVAVKVLEHTDVNERTLARFQREVRLTAKLHHPNTIEIFDFGQTLGGTFYYVMELIDGISLQQLIDYYGRQPPERVIHLLTQMCGSIAEAHRQGMIHRDIKPANVLVASRAGLYDLVKVVDFGLAKQVDSETMQLTRQESLTGTPLYMSPESIRDASAASIRSDIYSIGSVGYMLLTATAPFEGESSADICAKKLHEDPIHPQERLDVDFPGDLVRLLMRCLSRDPERRPASADELGKRLMRCRDSQGWSQRDAALWWREVFDGPSLEDMAALADRQPSAPASGTKGDTEVNDVPVPVSPLAAAATPQMP